MSVARTALGAFHRTPYARMDKPRANTAVTHKLARLVYFMLTRGAAHVDEGQQRYQERQRQRSITALERRAAAVGLNRPLTWSRLQVVSCDPRRVGEVISMTTARTALWTEEPSRERGLHRVRAHIGGLHCSLRTGPVEKGLSRQTEVHKVPVGLPHEQALTEFCPHAPDPGNA